MRHQIITALTAASLTIAAAHSVAAQDAEAFYKGKNVTFTVSAPAGTLTDVVARQFAPFFTKYMAGNPQVIVQNVAGAGGMLAAAQLQTGAPDDGTTLGFLQRNNLYVPLVEDNHSAFDPRKVEWVGSLEKVAYSIVTTEASEADTVQDLFDKKVFLGATGYSNENRTIPAILNDKIGTKFDIIHGYSGRGEVYLAMERGEVDGWASTVAGLAMGDTKLQIDKGQLKVLMHLGWESHPAFPDVPNLSSYVSDPRDRSLMDFFILPLDVGRPIAVPAGVPADRISALSAAIEKAAADPDFIAVMESQGYLVDHVDGPSLRAIIDRLYATPDDVLNEVRTLMQAKEPG